MDIDGMTERVAAGVTAGRLKMPPYVPTKRMKKMQNALEVIQNAQDAKHIWNVDLKELKWDVSHAYDDSSEAITREYRDAIGWDTMSYEDRNKLYGLFMPDDTPMYMIGLKKYMRGLAKYKGPLKREIQEWAEEWLAVNEAINSLKPFIEKGRKPDPNAKPKDVYQAPRVSTGGQKLVKAALEKVVQGQAKNLVNEMTEGFLKWAEGFLKNRDETQTDYEYFRGTGQYPVVSRLVERTDAVKSLQRSAIKEYALRSDAKQIAQKMAEAQVKDIVDRYLFKNTNKIGSVVEAKGGLEKVKVAHGNLAGWGFNGELICLFSDGAQFTVRNKVVVKVSMRGKWFNQFPTTFHDIIWADGNRSSMLSEKQMNEEWAKA